MHTVLKSFQEAVSIVLAEEKNLETETVSLDACLGRFTAQPIASLIDSPPFDKSAMDGYAIASGDTAHEFIIQETIAAGDTPEKSVSSGICSRIMTGAMLPEGAGKVVRIEYTEEADGIMRITTPEPYENIIQQGENLKKGEVFFPPKLVGPGDIGSLAASGIASVEVCRTVRIGIVTTGSELKEPGEALKQGEIYNSNGHQLSSQIIEAGGEPIAYGIVPDDPETHEQVIKQALEECDLILLSGGVSMGSFDYVPETLKKLGTEILVHGILVKPGRPALFGKNGKSFVFGLPGNPVSTFMLFEVLVKPFIHHLNKAIYRPAVRQARLLKSIKRRDTERLEFKPVKLVYDSAAYQYLDDPGLQGAEPVRYMGSAHLNALVAADGIIQMAPGVREIEEGAEVHVRLL